MELAHCDALIFLLQDGPLRNHESTGFMIHANRDSDDWDAYIPRLNGQRAGETEQTMR